MTPEFLAWALARPCELRQIDGWEDPERTERQLRGAWEFGAAVREGRRRGDLCLLDAFHPHGLAFSVSESLRIFGGEESVQAACQGCPVNVLAQLQPCSLAGCYGEVPLPQPASEFYEQVERAIDELDLTADIARLFPATRPRWFGLWMAPVIGACSEALAPILARLSDGATASDWRALALALEVAAKGKFPLHPRLYPRGEVLGKQWRLAPYCIHCRAEVADYRHCPACGAEGLPMPKLTRHVRGNRPYRPGRLR